MKIPTALVLSLIATASCFAAPQVEISARYFGSDRSQIFSDVAKKKNADGSVAMPCVTTKSGSNATIEIIREVTVPAVADAPTVVNAGITLDVTPEVKNGRINLACKSTVRKLLRQKKKQPLNAVSFDAKETFMSGTLADGESVTIRVGDGRSDQSKIVLTARLVP